MENDYFLGLDLGTGSLGWAVTNEQYEIQRAHGKPFGGCVYLKQPKLQKNGVSIVPIAED